MTEGYWLRIRSAEVALWLVTAAFVAVQAVMVGALRVTELLAPRASRLGERVVDLIAEVDQVSEQWGAPAAEPVAESGRPAESAGMVVDGQVIAVREEMVS